MKPTLNDPVKATWQGRPPHMSSNDFEIWMSYREIIPEGTKNLYFDVAVGEPILFAEGLEEEMQRVVNQVTRRRIDVVAETTRGWVIIELRWNAGPGAIGSVLTYRELWNMDPPDNRPVRTRIVTNYPDINILKTCKRLGIELEVV